MNIKLPADPIKKLITIMTHLRSDAGCPWDRIQSPETLKPYLLEETYEVLSALDSCDPDEICSELGDLLLQIVFLADIYREKTIFDFDAVAESISEKMIRRHPHVFSDSNERDLAQLDRQWESIKNSEKKEVTNSILEQQKSNLPALLQAQKLSGKVARVGFDWQNHQEVMAQLEEELTELNAAVTSGDKRSIRAEIGDILFTVVNLGRHLEIDCETALLEMIERFSSRFQAMEELISQEGHQLDQLDIRKLNSYWQKIKSAENEKP